MIGDVEGYLYLFFEAFDFSVELWDISYYFFHVHVWNIRLNCGIWFSVLCCFVLCFECDEIFLDLGLDFWDVFVFVVDEDGVLDVEVYGFVLF